MSLNAVYLEVRVLEIESNRNALEDYRTMNQELTQKAKQIAGTTFLNMVSVILRVSSAAFIKSHHLK
jgi:hypothetical protein